MLKSNMKNRISLRWSYRRPVLLIATSIALSFPVISGAQTIAYDNAELTDIIVNAYSHHPQLKSLRSQLRGTREAVVEARASYLPQVVLDGNFNASDRSALLQNGLAFNQNTAPKSLSLRLTQTLYTGGRRALAQRNASLTVQSSEARYETIAAEIAAEIIRDYMTLLSAKEGNQVLERSVETLRHLEISTIARRKAGHHALGLNETLTNHGTNNTLNEACSSMLSGWTPSKQQWINGSNKRVHYRIGATDIEQKQGYRVIKDPYSKFDDVLEGV